MISQTGKMIQTLGSESLFQGATSTSLINVKRPNPFQPHWTAYRNYKAYLRGDVFKGIECKVESMGQKWGKELECGINSDPKH
jgi:hypothetical protein